MIDVYDYFYVIFPPIHGRLPPLPLLYLEYIPKNST